MLSKGISSMKNVAFSNKEIGLGVKRVSVNSRISCGLNYPDIGDIENAYSDFSIKRLSLLLWLPYGGMLF